MSDTGAYRKRISLKIRIDHIFPFVLLVLIIIFVGGNSVNPDIKNYMTSYSNTGVAGQIEGSPLYKILVQLFSHLGVSFELFRLLIYSVGYFILWKANERIGVNSTLTYICYAISLMMADSTQTYNYLGMVCLYAAVSHLVSDQNWNRIKYIIWIAIAIGFHVAFLFYFPFIFVYSRTDRKQLFKIYIAVLAIMTILSTVASVSGLSSIIQRILTLIGMNSYQVYLNSRTRYGHLYPMIRHLLCCGCSFGFYYYAEKYEMESKGLLRIFLLLNLYGIFAFPLFRFQLTIARLTRNLELITFASGILYMKERNSQNSKIIVAVLLFIIALILGYYTVYKNYYDTIVLPFWNNNWILGR